MDYLYAVSVFIFVGSYVTFVLLDYVVYTEVIGFLAVFTEAMLGVPQFYKNYQNHSTTGMRLVCHYHNQSIVVVVFHVTLCRKDNH